MGERFIFKTSYGQIKHNSRKTKEKLSSTYPKQEHLALDHTYREIRDFVENSHREFMESSREGVDTVDLEDLEEFKSGHPSTMLVHTEPIEGSKFIRN